MALLKTFRLPAGLVNRLTLLAKATHRSETFYVADALKHYLEDCVDVQIAKDRFNDSRSSIVSGTEIKKKLGI